MTTTTPASTPVSPAARERLATPQAALDYHRVERVLRHLDARRAEQPSLEELARVAGLSPHHFQRLFVRWAGVSPKRFLAFLTREHAKTLLAEGASLLEASAATGLSTTSRLHDLFVTTEGVTPGEVGRGGEGLALAHGVHPSPFGPCFVARSPRGVCAMAFLGEDEGPERALADLARAYPRATLRPAPEATRDDVERAFARSADRPDLVLRGTPFQLQVWQALLELPPGHVASYGDLARRIGAPRASRAVGGALARNPIAVLVPCHRVIRGIGRSGPYRWGAVRKQALLAWESAGRA